MPESKKFSVLNSFSMVTIELVRGAIRKKDYENNLVLPKKGHSWTFSWLEKQIQNF